MKGKVIGYWILTALIGLAFIGGGIGDLTGAEPVVQSLELLGFPAYVATILGVWKLGGAVVVLAPGLKRLKEWAYAGIVIDLVSAVASHALNGDAIDQIMPPLVLTVIALGSYFLRPDNRKLDGPAV